MIEVRAFLDPDRPPMTMTRCVELHDDQPGARFRRGTVVTCEAGHEVAEFVVNVLPLQMICASDVAENRPGQDVWRQVEIFWEDRFPATIHEPVPCNCGRPWGRMRGGRVPDFPTFWEFHTAEGWR